MTPLRIFLSSPGDVIQERRIAARVIERLDAEFPEARLDPYFWEYEPMVITKDYQEQIPQTSSFDIVLCILWSRMGSRLHTKYRGPEGRVFRSGTEFEFVDAVEGQKRNEGKPEILVWVNKTQPRIPLEPEDVHMERVRQWRELKAFLREWTVDPEEKTLKGAVNEYVRLDEFEEKLETKLRKLIVRQTSHAETTDTEISSKIIWTSGSPFRGLEVYDVQHAPIFYGRTEAVAEAIDNLRRQNNESGSGFLMITGASGSGKSSLVRAGIVPMLIEPGVLEGIGLWRCLIIRAGDREDPFKAIATALLTRECLPELSTDGTTVDELAVMLRENPAQAMGLLRGALAHAANLVHSESKAQLLKKISEFDQSGRHDDVVAATNRLDQLTPPKARLLLVVDQFEELFGEKFDDVLRASFVHLISVLASSGRIFVMATIRSDFYSRCADIPELLALTRGDGMLQIGSPRPAEIGQIIRQPAQAAGLRFEPDPDTGESLDEMLRDAAIDQPTVLPLLGFCMQQLYEQRKAGNLLTLEAYARLGGVEGAVARCAESVFLSHPPEVKNELARLVRAAVTVGGIDEDSVTRRWAGYDELVDSASMKSLVDSLIDARLFVADTDESGTAIVGVAHEVLLRNWTRMADAIDEDREFLRVRARIARAARRWHLEQEDPSLLLPPGKQLEEGREVLEGRLDELDALEKRYIDISSTVETRKQRRRIRRLQFIAAAFGCVAVVAAGIGIYASKQRARAELRETEIAKVLNSADTHINNMLYELRDDLTALGQTELLDKVSAGVEEYFSGIPQYLISDDTERQYGTLLNWRGHSFVSTGHHKEAREKFEKSLKIARRRYQENPEGNQRARDLSITLMNLAQLDYARGDLDSAEKLYSEIESLPVDDTHPLSALDQVSVFSNHGDILRDRGDWEGAATLYQKAVDAGKDVYFDPEYRTAARNIPAALNRLAAARLNLGDLESATELTLRSLEISETLVEKFPGEQLFLMDLAIASNKAARLAHKSDDIESAIKHADRALELARSIYAQDQRSISALKQLLYALSMAGSLRMTEENAAHPERFGVYYEEGVPLARELVGLAPGITEHVTLLSTHLDGLALAQAYSGQFLAAIQTASEAIEALDRVEQISAFVRNAYESSYTRFFHAHQLAGTSDKDLVPALQHALSTAYRIVDAGFGDEKLEASIQAAQNKLIELGAVVPAPSQQ